MAGEEDRRDIERTLAGDGVAYERLVKRYESQIAAQMWRFSRNPTVCEELVQDIFVEVYFSLPNFRGEAPFFHWLRRIATRVGYRYWKQKARQELAVPLDLEALQAVAENPPPEIAGVVLHGLLAQLHPAQRLVLTLMYFEQCSVEEIAERTGWNSGVIKMRAHRARKKLKKLAEREKLLEKLEWIY